MNQSISVWLASGKNKVVYICRKAGLAAFTASVPDIRPESRGLVRLTEASAADAPSIWPNYLSTEEDRRVAAESIRLTRTIVPQPAMADYRPGELRSSLGLDDDEALARAAGDVVPPFSILPEPPRWARARRRRRAQLGVRGHRRPARRGRVDHADDHVRQHQRTRDQGVPA